MKKLFLFLLTSMLVLTFTQAFATTKTSIKTGTWNTATIWDGGIAPATGDDIIIASGDTVTLNANMAVLKSLTINSGGIFITASSYTVSCTTMTVNGTYKNGSTGTITHYGTITVNSGGTYQHAQNGGTVPTATWNVNSTLLVTGVTSSVVSGITGQTLGNLTWRCTGQTSGSSAMSGFLTVAGNLTIDTTGSYSFRVQATPMNVTGNVYLNGGILFVGGTNTKRLNVGGNVIISGGIFELAAGSTTGSLMVNGNFSLTGSGILRASGSSKTDSIVFNGSGIQTYTTGGTIANDSILYFVNSGSTLQMATASTIIAGPGSFTLWSGATLGITSSAGITLAPSATGSIQTGTRTFSTGANYIYNGSSAQVTGNGLPNTVSNLTVNNTNGVTLSAGTTVTNSLTIGPGSILDAAGFTLSAGSYSNSGTVRFSGATNGVAIGTGTVEYYGNSQTIAAGTYNNLILSGTGTVDLSSVTVNGTLSITGNVTATLPSGLTNLTINNSSGLTLNNPMTISGTLTFTLGNLLIGNNNLTLGGAVSGAADGRCIVTNGNGVISRAIATGDNFIFPVGTSARYNPVAFTSPLGGTYTAALVAGEDPPTADNTKTCMRTWTITGTNPADVTFTWNSDDMGGFCVPLSCTAWRYNESAWTEMGGLTSGSAPTYTTTLTGVASFSPWTIGNSGSLPVELTSFTAVLQGTSTLLKWSTATETNNSGFQIERSVEGSGVWAEVAFVNGAGTSSSPKTYSYEDKNLAPGKYIYRIKQIDNDGKFKYYTATMPKVDAGVSTILQLCGNYPNPFNPTTTVQFSVPQDGYASLKVYNMLGQEVETLFSGMAKAGHYIQATFNASRLASGIYFARLQYSGKSLIQRMLLTK